MSKDEAITALEQRVAFLEAALAHAQEENTIWDRIFAENYWGMVISDAVSGVTLKTNPQYAAMHGYSIPELIGKTTIHDVYAPNCQKDLPEIVRQIHVNGHYAYNSVQVKKDGSTFPVHVDAYEVTVNEKRLRIVSVWDITESELKEKELNQYRQNLEEAIKLRISELRVINKQLRSEIIQKEAAKNELHKANLEMVSLLESISDGFIAVNHKWIITYANKAIVAAHKANGLDDLLQGSNYWQIYKNNNKVINDFCLQVMKNGQSIRFESFAPLIGYWAEFSIYPTADGISIFCRNIEEKKKIKKAIEEEHHRLYLLFDSFPGLILVQEEDHTIRYANSSFQLRFGPYAGKPCYKVMAGLDIPCPNCMTSTVFRQSISFREEQHFDQHIYEVYIQPFTDADGSRLVVKVLIDITERKNAERELARLDRLNLVGEMAAGIAHEVRNPLTTVRGFLQMLGSKDDTTHYHEFYDLMIEELDRANLIITDFLSLARDKPSDFKLTNITKVVKSLSPLLITDALNQEKDIKLKLEQVTDIHGNENELRQLILNLARNGLEAMPRGTFLTIQTYILGNNIILEICDQGNGFDPLILEKLGTPFLTTKEGGTGLGLAICHSIVARHKAEINFDSNPTGTTVTVTFAVENKETGGRFFCLPPLIS